ISEIADVIPQFVPSTVNEVEDTAQNIGEMTFSNRSTMVSDTQQLLDEKRKILIDNGECEHITELTSSEIALLSEEQLSSSPEPLDLRKEEKKKMTVLACTSLNDQQKEKLHEFMQYFNCQSSLFIDETTTHLITSEQDETLACPLTGKVIQAVARHLFVVSYRWIIECLKQERLVSEDDYEIRGDLTFDKQHNGMNRSRTNSTQLLLENYAFLLKCSGYGPFDDNRPIIEMIELCGGIVLNNLTTDVNGIKRQIIILCSNDYKPNNLIMGACKRLNAQCLKTQWLLLSIINMDLATMDLALEKYKPSEATKEDDMNINRPSSLASILFPPNYQFHSSIIHMIVRPGSKTKNLLAFISPKFFQNDVKQITWNGYGDSISKAIGCAEITKRRFYSHHSNNEKIYQLNKIGYKPCEEYWEPVDANSELDRLKVKKDIPAICILLSKIPLNEED
ncbi:unnamed protein product, partial [Didymodactylos carnosus]